MALRADKIGERVDFARAAIDGYTQARPAREVLVEVADEADILAMLLVDLRHWANAQDLNFNRIDDATKMIYRAETEGPVCDG